mgnify:CR=1 FL=1
MVKEARLFKNGQSPSVRLPKEFRFEGSSVFIEKGGNVAMLIPKNDPWAAMKEGLAMFDEDFVLERGEQRPSRRDLIDS